MNAVKSLFVPIDGSTTAAHAAAYADGFALREHASLTFLNAVDGARDGAGFPPATNSVVRFAAMRRYGRELTASAERASAARAVAAQTLELGSTAPQALVNAARRRAASAIVVGSRADEASALVGPLADDILRLSELPVFLVSRAAAQTRPATSIVVAVDSSRPADAALDFALDLAGNGPARVIAVHILPAHISDAGVRRRGRVLDVARARAGRRGIAIETALGRGSVVAELADALKAVGGDLLVVGSDGPSKLLGLPLGSIGKFAAKTIDVPVAVVRASTAAKRTAFTLAEHEFAVAS